MNVQRVRPTSRRRAHLRLLKFPPRLETAASADSPVLLRLGGKLQLQLQQLTRRGPYAMSVIEGIIDDMLKSAEVR